MGNASVTFEVYDGGKLRQDWTIEADLTNELTLKDLRNTLKLMIIETANATFEEELALGFDKGATVFVDKNPRKLLADVDPFGRVDIVARQNMSEILMYIYNKIIEKSPVKTGKYISENVVFVNNIQVADNPAQLKSYLEGLDFLSKDKIRFVNLAPYARKLERYAVTKDKKAVPKINKKKDRSYLGSDSLLPNGVYALTSRLAISQYGKNAFIQFSFIDGEQISGVATSAKGAAINRYKNGKGSGRKSSDRTGKSYFYPSITVSVIGSAILTQGDLQ
jgi:hypothetical protein